MLSIFEMVNFIGTGNEEALGLKQPRDALKEDD